MDSNDLSKLDQWIEQLHMEISFSKEGDDRGQFPIRDLFANIAEKAGKDPAYGALKNLADGAALYVEDLMIGGQTYTAESLGKIKKFYEDIRSMREAGGGGEASASVAETPVTASVTPVAAAPAVELPVEVASAEEMPLEMNMDDLELLKEFINESKEHLQNVEQGILVLEENPSDEDTLNTTFRAFHSFKGGSGFLNLIPMNKLAHELESLLDLARTKQMVINSDVINLILTGADTLREMVVLLEPIVYKGEPNRPIIVATVALVNRVKAAIAAVKSGTGMPTTLEPKPAAHSTPAPAPVIAVAAPVVEAAKPAVVAPISAPAPVAAPVPAKAAASAAAKAPASQGEGSIVKIDTYKLDNLVDLVGELVIAQSQVSQDNDLRQITSLKLTRNVAQMARITKELQKTAMSLRMVPIRGTFQKMNRVVRDTAAKQGKEITLILAGEDTDVDRTISEELNDPLMHMIRNSCDHGIEMPDTREKRGKPRAGTVQLMAYHKGGSIVIEVRDDGGGLNKEKILSKAIEKGLVAPDAHLTDSEIFQLVFAPGFSTADQITDISGRGVGMDVVKKNIEKLRGKIEIESTPGLGAVFFIYLPLTLAIIDGMMIMVGGQKFILPTLSVRESFRPTKEMLSTVHERGEMVNVRGHLLPLVRVAERFGVPSALESPFEGIVIVVESGHEVRALLVDDLIGKQEIVIKSLNEQFKSNKMLAGAAILGDGTVGLIIDVAAFVESNRHARAAA
ncbi:MAG: chemotaxis protein CheA [Verrucomicrobiota bacterium]